MRPIDKIIQQGTEIDNPIISASKADRISAESTGKEKLTRVNFLFFIGLILLFLLILGGRIFYLQVVQEPYFQAMAENNRTRALVIKAPRGVIKDKQGTVLARNVPSYDAVFTPADLPVVYEQRKVIFEKVADILGMNKQNIETIMEALDHDRRESFLIKENIGYEAALIIEEKYQSLQGVYIDKTARRDYFDSQIFSSIIGYDGKITKEELDENPDYLMTDYIGKNGLEYVYEKYLHGKHGQHRVEVDSNGSIKEDLGITNPIPGDEVVMNIDGDLQKKIFELLNNITKENADSTGATAVAIDPHNGAVLALVNVPSYDNNLFARGITSDEYKSLLSDGRKPMLNRAISGEYPPGSTYKPLIAVAALEERIVTEHTSINCPGSISKGSWVFPDWKTHGITDIRKAIAESCDVFFYAIGGGWENINGLGIDRMSKYAKLFGVGEVLGIDLPGESNGNTPNEEWKFKTFGEKWYIGDDYHCSIGQGFITTTPLQLANYIAAIANGGTLYKPQVVDKIINTDNKETQDIQPEIIRKNFVSVRNIQIVREGMRQTVTDGSASQLNELKVTSAGKTGTAQFGSEDKTHSWYVSFAPYENPQIAMVVLVEGGGEGHSWSVPVTKEIYKWYFDERPK